MTNNPQDIKQQVAEGVVGYDPSHHGTVDALHTIVKELESDMDIVSLLDRKYTLPGWHINNDVQAVEWQRPPPELTGWQITTRIDNARRKIDRLQRAVDSMKHVLNTSVNAWDEAVNRGEFTK